MGHDPLTRRRNTSVFAGITVASLIFTIILRISLMIENRRRDRLSREQYNRESAVQDPCDWVSSYLISLNLCPIFLL